mgnify:CR=1 FL=1
MYTLNIQNNKLLIVIGIKLNGSLSLIYQKDMHVKAACSGLIIISQQMIGPYRKQLAMHLQAVLLLVTTF